MLYPDHGIYYFFILHVQCVHQKNLTLKNRQYACKYSHCLHYSIVMLVIPPQCSDRACSDRVQGSAVASDRLHQKSTVTHGLSPRGHEAYSTLLIFTPHHSRDLGNSPCMSTSLMSINIILSLVVGTKL